MAAVNLVLMAQALAGSVRQELGRPMAAVLPAGVRLVIESQAALLLEMARRLEAVEALAGLDDDPGPEDGPGGN